jgi:Na+/serine symporter
MSPTAASPTDPTRRQKIGKSLADNSHVWTIIIFIILGIIYFFRRTSPLQTQAGLLGELALFALAAIGFTGGVLALLVMVCSKSEDFGVLHKLQNYLVLGVAVTVVATGAALFQWLNIISVLPAK